MGDSLDDWSSILPKRLLAMCEGVEATGRHFLPRGRGLLIRSGTDVDPFQAALSGRWESAGRFSPFYMNRILRNIVEAVSIAARQYHGG